MSPAEQTAVQRPPGKEIEGKLSAAQEASWRSRNGLALRTDVGSNPASDTDSA